MKLPNAVSAFLLAVLLYGLQYLLAHIGAFSIPEAYVSIVAGLQGVAITAIAKLVQETSADATPSARGMDGPAQQSVAQRVLLG